MKTIEKLSTKGVFLCACILLVLGSLLFKSASLIPSVHIMFHVLHCIGGAIMIIGILTLIHTAGVYLNGEVKPSRHTNKQAGPSQIGTDHNGNPIEVYEV